MQTRSAGGMSSLAIARDLVGREGGRALFKGMASPIVSVGFMNAVLFHSFSKGKHFFDVWAVDRLSPLWCLMAIADNAQEQLKMLENRGIIAEKRLGYLQENSHTGGSGWEATIDEDRDRAWSVFLGGCVGGIACAFITCPSELVKIQMQVLKVQAGAPPFTGSWSCARHLVQTEGVTSLGRGMCVTLLRDVYSYGGYFLSYEMSKTWMEHRLGCRRDAAITQLTSGAVAGVIAWSCCYPIDVVKSRIQSDMKGREYSSIWRTAVKSYRRDGIKVFFRGYVASVLRAVPVNATTFLTYEWVLTLLP